jgi:anti-anti-sigma factor
MAVVRVDQYGLTIATAERNELVVVFVAGRLDVWSAPLLARTLEGLLAQRFQSLWVSLAGVTHIDGRGIEVLLNARERASDSGREFEIRSPSSEVARRLEDLPDFAAPRSRRASSGLVAERGPWPVAGGADSDVDDADRRARQARLTDPELDER